MQKILTIRTVYLAAIIFFMAVVCFAAFYWLSDYNYLKQWYFSLHGCFYKNESWAENFFTPKVKGAGNIWCITAIIFSFAGIAYSFIRLKKHKPVPSAEAGYSVKTFLWPLALVIIMGLIWLWGYRMVRPAYDEIFSAVNCAGLHPFQTLSYYMLPNNHAFFNLLNGTLFFWVEDKVLTGRLISLVAYLALSVVLFRFFSKLFANRIFAFTTVIVVLLQFAAWGFGFQARGYELQLLAAWVAFIAFLKYWEDGNPEWLRWNAFGCFIAFIIIPSFLYFYAAMFLFALTWQLYSRKPDLVFWKYQFICFVFVFLFYLPLLCFSGLQSLSENNYVKPVAGSWEEFMPDFITRFKYYINYCFSFIIGENNKLNYLLFLLPGALLFSRKRANKGLGVFYVLTWLAFVVITLYMKRSPFARNLIIQYSFSITLVIYTFYWLLNAIWMRIKMGWLAWIIYPGLTGLLCLHFINYNREKLNTDLYYNDINTIYKGNIASIKKIPAGSSIGFSRESFYWFYYCSSRDLKAAQCPSGNEDYFITRCDEEIPKAFSDQYTLLRTEPDCYNVYRHK